MVAPVNHLVRPPAKVSRTAVLDDTSFETVVTLRELLGSNDPKVVLAAKVILEFEKVRQKAGGLPFLDEPAEAVAAPPAPVAPSPPDPVINPRPPEQLRIPPLGHDTLCPPVGGGGTLRGVVEPSISSFLPPRITGSPACPRPTPTPLSSPTPPS